MAEKKKEMPMNGPFPGGKNGPRPGGKNGPFPGGPNGQIPGGEIREKYKMKPGAMRGRGPGGRGRSMERPKDAIGTTKRVLAYLKDYKLQLCIVALTLIVTAVTGVAAREEQNRSSATKAQPWRTKPR